MLIGNDIVDLKDVDAYPPSENERFLNRVFRPEEQEYIKSSDNPKKTLWMFWALKESAYKAWKRNYPRIIFSPISMRIDFVKQKVIHHNYGRLSYKIDDGNDDWIAVYVFKPRTEKSSKLLHWIGEVSKLTKDQQFSSSIAARTLVSQKLAELLSLSPENLEVSKELPPVVRELHTGFERPVSLSHHGRFVSAFMAIPTNPGK